MSGGTAIVINMFYTGLGIARSLGERGIRVIGLSAHRGIYGNYTRYAEVRRAPDSRGNPEELLLAIEALGREIEGEAMIFPTRDDDVLFLHRYRDRLQLRFKLLLPPEPALNACLNKDESVAAAAVAGVPCPRCWSVEKVQDIQAVAAQAEFPCVLKPVSAHHWRKPEVWAKAGNRKAIAARSAEELLKEYAAIFPYEPRALVQEMVEGSDDCLWIAACYLNGKGRFVTGYTAQKLLQVPSGFGTGCIVQAAERPELLDIAVRLLENMGFSGIAEVEFKWDERRREFRLIEVNARPWDQHRLGKACGADLVYTAWCELMENRVPPPPPKTTGYKWIAEDVYALLLLRSAWKRDGSLGPVRQIAAGKRVYAIWSAKDPLPALGFLALRFGPGLFSFARQLVGRMFTKRNVAYEKALEHNNCGV
jgi:D-aspartate ligase